jgi:nucleotide-binding universal stress UspA family protein
MPSRTELFRHVLHATDFSAASRKAFAAAVDVARTNRAALTIVHVLAPVVPVVAGEGMVLPETYAQMEASVRMAAQKQLDRLLARARDGGVQASGLLLTGVPHEAIVRTAKSKRADLLVIGTHGRTGLARLFLGSVATRVLALASCPVLTVRGR